MAMRWKPLEANPDVLTSFAASIGANGGDVNFQDVYGLDEELLAMVPTPVLAVVVLYPLTEATEAIQPNPTGQKPTDLFYMKQTIGNACGTIAVMHCLTNNTERIRLEEGSFLDRFIKDTVNMTPEARGKFLEEQSDLESAHAGAASEGDTVAPGVDDEINLHFVALVNKGGRLLELDGRKAGPIDHGPTSEETLLQDSAKIVKNLVQITNSYNFSILALCKA
eukprot:jgi/Pico_ML_1/54126/g4547.t2